MLNLIVVNLCKSPSPGMFTTGRPMHRDLCLQLVCKVPRKSIEYFPLLFVFRFLNSFVGEYFSYCNTKCLLPNGNIFNIKG